MNNWTSPENNPAPILDSIQLSKPTQSTPDLFAILLQRRNSQKAQTLGQLPGPRVIIHLFMAIVVVIAAIFGKGDHSLFLDLTIRNPIFYIIAIVLGGFVLWIFVQLAPYFWVLNAITKTNYAAAARRSRITKNFLRMKSAGAFLEGTTYTFSGNWLEAELALQESIEITGDNIVSFGAWENLGYVMLGQQRYKQAINSFERAITLKPDASGPYSGLAEAYLYQNINPHRALRLVNHALELKLDPSKTLADAYRIGEMLAVKAWATAQIGDHQEAETILQQALTEADPKMRPTLASIHLRAGKIYRLLNNQSAANKHFQHAYQIDPNGAYGQRAFQVLREM